MCRLPFMLLVVLGCLFCLLNPAASVDEEEWDGLKVPTDSQLVKLLVSYLTRETTFPITIHETNVYSAAPEHLVDGRKHAPGTGDGSKGSCYFLNDRAPPKKRRPQTLDRMVRDSSGEEIGRWHQQGSGKQKGQILDIHKKSMGAYKTTFSYQEKRGKNTGWCMTEFSISGQDDGEDQKVLCLVYQSNRQNRKGSTVSPSTHGGDSSSSLVTPSPKPGLSSTTNLHLEADGKGKAVSYGESIMGLYFSFTTYFDRKSGQFIPAPVTPSLKPGLSIGSKSCTTDLNFQAAGKGKGKAVSYGESITALYFTLNTYFDGKSGQFVHAPVTASPKQALFPGSTSTTNLPLQDSNAFESSTGFNVQDQVPQRVSEDLPMASTDENYTREAEAQDQHVHPLMAEGGTAPLRASELRSGVDDGRDSPPWSPTGVPVFPDPMQTLNIEDDVPFPMPVAVPWESGLHVMDDCQASYCSLCITDTMGAGTNDISRVDQAGDSGPHDVDEYLLDVEEIMEQTEVEMEPEAGFFEMETEAGEQPVPSSSSFNIDWDFTFDDNESDPFFGFSKPSFP